MLIFADFNVSKTSRMRKMLRFILVAALVAVGVNSSQLMAQIAVPDTSIVQYLERSITGGTVQITQPAELSRRVSRGAGSVESDAVKVPVYRIQLYSSNNSNAKAEAEELLREVELQFPGLLAVVSYVSPFWRLRVGEFRTYEEASAMQLQIQNKFPEMERGILIIRERVNMQVRDYSKD